VRYPAVRGHVNPVERGSADSALGISAPKAQDGCSGPTQQGAYALLRAPLPPLRDSCSRGRNVGVNLTPRGLTRQSKTVQNSVSSTPRLSVQDAVWWKSLSASSSGRVPRTRRAQGVLAAVLSADQSLLWTACCTRQLAIFLERVCILQVSLGC